MTTMNPDESSREKQLLDDPTTPRWLRELEQFLPVKSHFILYGNIRDSHPVALMPSTYYMFTTQQLLVDYLDLKGFRCILSINPLETISILTPSSMDANRAGEEAARWVEGVLAQSGMKLAFHYDKNGRAWRTEASFGVAVEVAEALAHNQSSHCAIIFDYLMGQTEQGQTREIMPFVRSLIASYEVRPFVAHNGSTFYNTVFWLCDRDNDLPAWFALNNPRVRTIAIGKPDANTRSCVAPSLLANIKGFDQLAPEAKQKVVNDFSSQTDGLLMSDLEAISRFIPSQDLKVTEIAEAARRYKLGVKEDPWRKITRESLGEAEQTIRRRVKGQEPAITKSLDIIRRAVMGLSGAHVSRATNKPKGVLFFAGPTGVGKTELAKSITEALFGDETAYIRFDMSEFNHEHSDQRLIGAPPGYVGFESGGELTDAIRARPFSVVLFDEIEKAHGRILDKFLQILDDGQLTSGKGERVYFTDALLVFTSNLGMDEVKADDDYADLEQKLRDGVTLYFQDKLHRPELLNRIGDNIVIFDFIRPKVAIEILSKMIQSILARIYETHEITITLRGFPISEIEQPDTPFEFLVKHCTSDLKHGGRGIGNMLESWFLNPLSRAMWEMALKPGDTAEINHVWIDQKTPSMELVRR